MASNDSTELEQKWIEEQDKLKTKLIIKEDIDIDRVRHIGGVDISFQKEDSEHACPGLVVLSYPDLKIVYKDFSLEHVHVPYVPHFLAFREAPLLKEKIDKLKKEHPDLMPQVIMVDGNGMHHSRGFGIACHLGVITDLPSIGVAKNLLHIDGVSNNQAHSRQIQNDLRNKGDTFPLKGTSGDTTGMVLRSSVPCGGGHCKPIYVSVGHRISLETAVKLVLECCKYRIPEPTRQADILSKKYLRENYEKELTKCSCKIEGKT